MADRLPIRRVLLAGLLATAVAGVSAERATAAPTASAAPSSLPGLPPGSDTGYPAAPAAGTTLGPGAAGPSSRIPAHVAAPGLLGSTALLRGRVVSLMIACPSKGRATISDAAVGAGALGHASYTCKAHRAAVSFTLSAAHAKRVKALRSSTGKITLGSGHATASFPITLALKPAAAHFWGQDGGLQCNFYGRDRAFLASPNFTVTPDATIDVRPWVAFYTFAHGWQWLGTGGLNHSTWYQWTASPSGVLQWINAAGALNRWNWPRINAPSGQSVWAIAGFEVVYLYNVHAEYAWRFAVSQPATGASTTYCAYS
jgi:hypothetical protein